MHAILQGQLGDRASKSTDSTSFYRSMVGGALPASRARMNASERIRRTRQAVDISLVGGGNSSASFRSASGPQHVDDDLDFILSDEDDRGDYNGGEYRGGEQITNPTRDRSGGRKGFDDIPVPDTGSMSESERQTALKAYRSAKNRLAVRKYRAEKAAAQAKHEDAMDGGMYLRELEPVASTPDGTHEARVTCGIRYNTKTEIMHAIREFFEFLGTAVHFPLSNNFEVHAVPRPSDNIGSDGIDIQARYIRKKAA